MIRTAVLLSAVALLVIPAAASAAPGSTDPQAYHGVRVSGELPEEAIPPASTPAAYDGPQLALQYAYVGRDAAEPTIAIDTDGVAFMTAGAFDALGLPGALARQLLMRSTDGGISWKPVPVPFYAAEGEPTTLDPYVAFDALTGRVFALTLLGADTYIAYSDNHGEDWEFSQTTSPGFNDHQTLATAKPPEGVPYAQTSDTFPNLVYYCVNHVSDSRCTRSIDGGQTWLPSGGPAYAPGPGEEACAGGLHGHFEGDNAGRALLPAGHCGLPMLSVSTDAGLTWRRSIVSNKIGAADVHTAVAVDKADNYYYIWYDNNHRLPWLAVSTDQGESWSEPLMVAPPGVKEVNFPEIVAGDAGRIAITFPGGIGADADDPRKRSTEPDRPWFSYVVVANNALDPNPTFHSNVAGPRNDPVHRGNCDGRCAGMFDFIDIQLSPKDGSVWATATDTCTPQNDCHVEATSANDAEGVAIRQIGGPWLVGEGPAQPAKPTAAQQPPPPVPTPAAQKAPSARLVRVTCKRRTKRCAVRLKGAPGGTKVSVRLYRGRVLAAEGARRLKGGRATLRLRTRGKLRAGRYRLLVSTVRAGATPSRVERKIRLR